VGAQSPLASCFQPGVSVTAVVLNCFEPLLQRKQCICLYPLPEGFREFSKNGFPSSNASPVPGAAWHSSCLLSWSRCLGEAPC
jgi:hypothetical protein